MKLYRIIASVCKVKFNTYYDANKMSEIKKRCYELSPLSFIEEVSSHRFAWLYPEGMSGVEEELVKESKDVISCEPYEVEIWPVKTFKRKKTRR